MADANAYLNAEQQRIAERLDANAVQTGMGDRASDLPILIDADSSGDLVYAVKAYPDRMLRQGGDQGWASIVARTNHYDIVDRSVDGQSSGAGYRIAVTGSGDAKTCHIDLDTQYMSDQDRQFFVASIRSAAAALADGNAVVDTHDPMLQDALLDAGAVRGYSSGGQDRFIFKSNSRIESEAEVAEAQQGITGDRSALATAPVLEGPAAVAAAQHAERISVDYDVVAEATGYTAAAAEALGEAEAVFEQAAAKLETATSDVSYVSEYRQAVASLGAAAAEAAAARRVERITVAEYIAAQQAEATPEPVELVTEEVVAATNDFATAQDAAEQVTSQVAAQATAEATAESVHGAQVIDTQVVREVELEVVSNERIAEVEATSFADQQAAAIAARWTAFQEAQAARISSDSHALPAGSVDELQRIELELEARRAAEMNH